MPEKSEFSPNRKRQEAKKEAIATLLNKEEMVKLLKEAEIYGKTPELDKMYDSFIENIAGSKKNGMDLVRAWELAKYYTLKDYPPKVTDLVDEVFDQFLDAILPLNPDLANEAKTARDQTQQGIIE
jgi:hypothetical protein